jgi:hypothetical protein
MNRIHGPKDSLTKPYRLQAGKEVIASSVSLDSAKKRAAVLYKKHGNIMIFYVSKSQHKYLGVHRDSKWVSIKQLVQESKQ